MEGEAHSSFKRLQAESFSSRQAEQNLLEGRKVGFKVLGEMYLPN